MHSKYLRQYRLSDKKRIARLSRSRQKKVDSRLFIRMLENDLGYPRLVISIRKKDYPRAVDRNFIKRKIREKFRKNIQQLKSRDFMMSVRPIRFRRDYSLVERSLKKLLDI